MHEQNKLSGSQYSLLFSQRCEYIDVHTVVTIFNIPGLYVWPVVVWRPYKTVIDFNAS